MSEKIFDKDCEEYISYGHYQFDNEQYYSLEQYKNEFLFEESTRAENQSDSNELMKYLSFPSFKTKPEKGKDEFIRVYNFDLLNEFFN